MGYDLHIHSTYSDGTLNPAELIHKAIDRGLTGIALTDHDTIAGISEAVSEAKTSNFQFIPGIELTTDYGSTEVHVLGYDFDIRSPRLQRKLELIIESRNGRAQTIIRKLNKHRIPLSWEKVRAQTTSKFVGRSHIFRAMEKEGLVNREHRQQTFEYFLGKNGVAYEPHHEIDTFEAIDLIKSNGGIPVLAHPGRMDNNLLISELVEAGLQGLEVYYPTHSPDLVTQYLELAARYRLFVTGGTDYHGAYSTVKLGEYQIPVIPWH